MKMNRRRFLGYGAAAAASGMISLSFDKADAGTVSLKKIDAAAQQPVLKTNFFQTPVIIKSIDLLRYKDSFLCHVRSTDGAEGWSVSNNMRMVYLYPVLVQRIKPFFIGKDARDLETLVDGVYRYRSNYKFQSYALWVPVATVEFAVLDMLGHMAGKSIGELIGDIYNRTVAVYLSPHSRLHTAEQSVEMAQAEIEKTGIKAVKFKIGKKMGENDEDVPGRSKKLVPLARKKLGNDTWLGVDANGGYDLKKAIQIGRLLSDNHYDFYEEPLPFDWYHDLQKVSAAISVPVAGGEQEASMRNFRWLIANRVVQIVRPDMFYFGGMIRSMRVARMAQAAGLSVVPHLSGSGLGYLYAMHFISALSNAGPYHPNTRPPAPIPMTCPTSSLQIENGTVKVPTGPGLGIVLDTDFVKKHKIIDAA